MNDIYIAAVIVAVVVSVTSFVLFYMDKRARESKA